MYAPELQPQIPTLAGLADVMHRVHETRASGGTAYAVITGTQCDITTHKHLSKRQNVGDLADIIKEVVRNPLNYGVSPADKQLELQRLMILEQSLEEDMTPRTHGKISGFVRGRFGKNDEETLGKIRDAKDVVRQNIASLKGELEAFQKAEQSEQERVELEEARVRQEQAVDAERQADQAGLAKMNQEITKYCDMYAGSKGFSLGFLHKYTPILQKGLLPDREVALKLFKAINLDRGSRINAVPLMKAMKNERLPPELFKPDWSKKDPAMIGLFQQVILDMCRERYPVLFPSPDQFPSYEFHRPDRSLEATRMQRNLEDEVSQILRSVDMDCSVQDVMDIVSAKMERLPLRSVEDSMQNRVDWLLRTDRYRIDEMNKYYEANPQFERLPDAEERITLKINGHSYPVLKGALHAFSPTLYEAVLAEGAKEGDVVDLNAIYKSEGGVNIDDLRGFKMGESEMYLNDLDALLQKQVFSPDQPVVALPRNKEIDMRFWLNGWGRLECWRLWINIRLSPQKEVYRILFFRLCSNY